MVVDTVSVTIKAYQNSYTFLIELDDREVERLSRETILGVSFKKNKYQFLKDLSDVLAAEILLKMEEITK